MSLLRTDQNREKISDFKEKEIKRTSPGNPPQAGKKTAVRQNIFLHLRHLPDIFFIEVRQKQKKYCGQPYPRRKFSPVLRHGDVRQVLKPAGIK